MRTKKYIVPLLVAAVLALAAGGATAAYILMNPSIVQSVSASDLGSGIYLAHASSTPPQRLLIPSISIDALVQQVGRTATGAMGTPNNFTDVGWYKYGPEPGEEGSAVIGGHLDNALALSGVFKHLNTLAVGAEVGIQTAGGKTLHFKVIRTAVYPYDQVPLQELFSQTGGSYLNLVTCSGTWLPQLHTYSQRLIVYTALVS